MRFGNYYKIINYVNIFKKLKIKKLENVFKNRKNKQIK